MTTTETSDIFGTKKSVLITNVVADDRPVDIFIDAAETITDIGGDIRKRHRGEAEFVIDGDGALALAGLANTHTHAAMTLLRGYADDMILQDWLARKIWPLEAHLTADDVYWGTKLACLEMIRTGTTAFNDMYFYMEDADPGGGRGRHPGRALLRFYQSRGCRETGARVPGNGSAGCPYQGDGQPADPCRDGPHAPYTVSPEGLKWCAAFAQDEKIGIHIHLAETEKEVRDCISQHGKRTVSLLDGCGILTPKTIAAHGCWLDDDECTLLAQRGVSVSHNPSSNMKTGHPSGAAVPETRRAGANVCLGTDGCASNNSLDLFGEVKCAALLQKFFWNDPTILPHGSA